MIRSFLYEKENDNIRTDIAVSEYKEVLKEEDNLLWVDVHDLTGLDKDFEDFIEILMSTFGLHALTVEDCIVPNARPKAEQFPGYIFIVLHAASSKKDILEEEPVELDICLGPNFIITFHSEPLKSIDVVLERCKKGSPIIKRGSDFLVYTIADTLVDNYFPIVDELDREADDIEDEVFEDQQENTLNKIYQLKKKIMVLRRIISPQRDVIRILITRDMPLIKSSTDIYFRDVYDHLVRVYDLLDASRDIVTSALESYMSIVSNRTNEIMRVLTVIATIMMPLTLLTGIYGMNFKFMPEFGWKHGYLFFWGIFIIISVGLLMFFKRKKLL